jgi:hypothetical protein
VYQILAAEARAAGLRPAPRKDAGLSPLKFRQEICEQVLTALEGLLPICGFGLVDFFAQVGILAFKQFAEEVELLLAQVDLHVLTSVVASATLE